MSPKRFYIPQIQRTIPALLTKALARTDLQVKKLIFKFGLSLLVLVIMLNIFYWQFQNKPEERNIADKILLNPDNSALHESLGKKYITFNIYAAKREYALSEEFRDLKDPSTSPLIRFEQIKDYDKSLTGEYLFWENIFHSYPDYEYAKLKLAEISNFKGDNKKTEDFIDSVLKNNPYDPAGLNLRDKIGEK